MKKIFIHCLLLSMIISSAPLCASKKNDSIAVVSGASSIVLATMACARGKMDQQAAGLIAGSLATLGIGHYFSTEQGIYTMAVVSTSLMTCLVGYIFGETARK